MRKALNQAQIKKLLKEKGWTQKRIAWLLSINESMVSRVISGEKKSQRVLNTLRMATEVADLTIQPQKVKS